MIGDGVGGNISPSPVPTAVWWARPRVAAARVGVIFGTTSLLWLPTISWLASPDRQVLGAPGHLLIIGSLAIQTVAIALGFVFVGVMYAWDESRVRRGARMWGWLALIPGAAFAYFLASSLLKGVFDSTLVLVVTVVLMLAPTLIPSNRMGFLATVTVLYTFVSIGISAVATAHAISPILIAPVTAYAVALTLRSTAANYART